MSGESELGPPDLVVTAAGVQHTGPSGAVAAEEWRRTIDVNLTGTWIVVQAALAGMLERRRGRVVTIASEVGLAGLPGYAAYAASKGSVIALTKALARELAPRGIAVNSVAPGPIEAGMLLEGTAYSEDWLAAHVPLGRFGRPEGGGRVRRAARRRRRRLLRRPGALPRTGGRSSERPERTAPSPFSAWSAAGSTTSPRTSAR